MINKDHLSRHQLVITKSSSSVLDLPVDRGSRSWATLGLGKLAGTALGSFRHLGYLGMQGSLLMGLGKDSGPHQELDALEAAMAQPEVPLEPFFLTWDEVAIGFINSGDNRVEGSGIAFGHGWIMPHGDSKLVARVDRSKDAVGWIGPFLVSTCDEMLGVDADVLVGISF